MKTLTKIFTSTCVGLLFSSIALAASNDSQYAFVNVTDLFNHSSFVQTANTELRKEIKSMEELLQRDQDKLKDNIKLYQDTTNAAKKKELSKTIAAQQTTLATMTQQYQQKIQTMQNEGMQEFTKLVKVAVDKVAKSKNYRAVFNSAALIYTDEAWIDISSDVASEMAKK